ncbi:glycosyltransferase [Priestia megaterium]|nr:glycosyltransferase [Priestia megaterium]
MGSIRYTTDLLKEAEQLREEYANILNRIIEEGEDYQFLPKEKVVDKEKISIIIPFYNCPYVNQAIESALNQTYENVEVIVVDDGSTLYQEKIIPYIHKIKYIEKENGGTASALNVGIKNATGKYFTWLSSDDMFDSNKLAEQLEFMKSKGAIISYTPVIYIDAQSNPISEPIGVQYPNRLYFLKGLSQACTINGCAVMMEMKVFSDIGVFDETLPYTHDYDLWLRAAVNYEFHYLNKPLVLYRIHDGMGTKRFMDKINQEVSAVRKKHEKVLNELILDEENKKHLF